MKRMMGLFLCASICLGMLAGCGVSNTRPDERSEEKSAAPTGESMEINLESHFEDVTPEYSLRFSLQDPAAYNKEILAALSFRNYVESHTDGKVQVKIFPGAQLGKEREAFEAVSAGDLDIAMVTDGPIAGFVPEMQTISIPFLFRSGAVAWDVLSGEFGDKLKEQVLEKTNVKILGVGANGFRCFTNNGHVVKTLEDMKGLKFRVMENPMYLTMIEALGAQPIPMAGGEELYSALQQKVVDGQENPLDINLSFRFYEVQDYLTVDNHTYSSKWLCFSNKVFESMPKEYQDILIEGGRIWQSNLEGAKEDFTVESYFTGLDFYKETYTLPQGERERFKDACQPAVIEWMKTQVDPQWVDDILNATAAAEKELYE